MTLDPPAGWQLWDEGDDRVVLAYRPDVFDGSSLPAPCLPTLYVTRGQRDRRPGGQRTAPDTWFVTLYCEPEVTVTETRSDTRPEAIDAAESIAEQFAAGGIDYRAAYQVPRPAYFEMLDELTGGSRDAQSNS